MQFQVFCFFFFLTGLSSQGDGAQSCVRQGPVGVGNICSASVLCRSPLLQLTMPDCERMLTLPTNQYFHLL